MNISMPIEETQYLKDIIEKCKGGVYVEFGSGGSTIYASRFMDKVYSVESSQKWIDKVKDDINSNNVTMYYVDIDAENMPWGHPSPHCPKEKKPEYSRTIYKIKDNIDLTGSSINLVLIDGRFRVACALHTLSCITTDTIVLFDDFFDRLEHYSVVLDYYDVVKQIGRMAHLKKKDMMIPTDILQKYEYISM